MMKKQRKAANVTSDNASKSTTKKAILTKEQKRKSRKSLKSSDNAENNSNKTSFYSELSSSKDKRECVKLSKQNDLRINNPIEKKIEKKESKFRKKINFKKEKEANKKSDSNLTETARKSKAVKKEAEEIRLNKYIANAGFCSRREADKYIESGVVTVNGKIITELGYKIKPGDRVMFGGKLVIGEKPVYILLNKPKDYITTSKDPHNRRTVLDLIKGVKERVFAVGRLDRNTTGLLLLTNDGDLANKLMHPRKKVAKIYHVELDRKFTHAHLEQLRQGVMLEDGFFKPDDVSFAEGMDKKHIGIEIHSGKYRIVRRLFEHLGYKVVKLDRVYYAGLTKKGLPRGSWRYLEPWEVGMLKML